MRISTCRACRRGPLDGVLRLGKIPPVNYFPSGKELSKKPPMYRLRLCLCRHCGLVQLDETPPAEILFRHYHYLTSASSPLLDHFRKLARECKSRGFVRRGSKVLDIGANDGTLLAQFRACGARALGVDPARNAVQAATRHGIRVLPQFFNQATARALRQKEGPFQVITATNVLAQTDNLDGFLTGVKQLLAPRGIFIAEFAHLLDMVVKNQFDVIYHEHLSYFSFAPLTKLFEKHGLEIFDAKKILTQGGSLRVYSRHRGALGPLQKQHLETIRREEDENHVQELATLKRFAAQVKQFRADLRALMRDIGHRRQRVAGFGAPAKGVVLLHYCGLGPKHIEYIVDSTPLKQGRFFPGLRIPVFPENKLLQDRPDYVFVLAWNFQDVILEKLKGLRSRGTKVILPFPKLRVIA